MTSAEMLARVRTLLDEASAGLWSDSEIYSALSDGQRAIVQSVLAIYKVKKGDLPKVLAPLVTYAAGALTSAGNPNATLPSDFLYHLNVEYDPTGSSQKPCIVVDQKEEGRILRNNTYYSASNTDAFYLAYYDVDTSGNYIFHFDPTNSTTGAYAIRYIKTPTDIDGSTNPILPEIAHNAIVQYAFAELLAKDEKYTEANYEFRKFTQQLSQLYL
ncbi:MAG: hypothetical protein D6732_00040 [Methanobacteriota archaeon]|nr:MAG: hypothetical protein D6732_00040 [Euryarchaeota archaeon]